MRLDGKTRIYGLFGYPIEHTGSPVMHNAAYDSLSLNCVYIAFHVKPDGVKKAIKNLALYGISGINLTIPYKEVALRSVDECSREATLIGAVNTIHVVDGKLAGYNTDGIGFVQSLREDAGTVPDNKKVVVLGAGGAGRAVCFQLMLEGAKSLTVANRRLDFYRARRLVSGIKRSFPAALVEAVLLDDRKLGEQVAQADILVNATSCGMKPGDPLLVDLAWLHSRLVVYDLVYAPPRTKLLESAEGRVQKAVSGMGMLVRQGAASFKIWTGMEPPVDVMRQALAEFLKHRDLNNSEKG
jgi:shikimate dehydrogenase